VAESHRLWLPGVIRKPIPAGSNDPQIIPVGAVFHVAVSRADSLHDYFDGPSGGIESTGYIRADGTIEQYRPVTTECDAQGDGNSWISGGRRYGLTSWETEGMGPGEWTSAQLASIKLVISWHHKDWGIPLRRNPGWNAAGFGYHCLFDRWNRNAHSCPGPQRVEQFNHEIVPWMRRGGDGDDMSYLDWPKKDREALAADMAKAVLRTKDVNNRTADGDLQKVVSLAAQVSNTESSVDQLRGEVRELTELINRHFNKE
jgi:hypothetical protein